MVAKFAAGVIDTGGHFAAGVVDTGGKFATGVVDTFFFFNIYWALKSEPTLFKSFSDTLTIIYTRYESAMDKMRITYNW